MNYIQIGLSVVCILLLTANFLAVRLLNAVSGITSLLKARPPTEQNNASDENKADALSELAQAEAEAAEKKFTEGVLNVLNFDLDTARGRHK